MKIFIIFVVWLFCISTTFAEDSNISVATDDQNTPSSIQQKAKELRDFSELLRSDDEFVRRITIEKAFKMKDPIYYEMALKAGLSSDDKDLQLRTIQEWLSRKSQFAVELILPEEPNKEQTELFNKTSPLWFSIKEINTTKNEISLLRYGKINSNDFTGSFVPGGFDVYHKMSKAFLSLRADGQTSLIGTYSEGPSSSLVAKVLVK